MSEQEQKKPTVRLLKVLVQPVLVSDDGQTLRELTTQVAAVMAQDWPQFSAERFGPADMELYATTLAEQPAPE